MSSSGTAPRGDFKRMLPGSERGCSQREGSIARARAVRRAVSSITGGSFSPEGGLSSPSGERER